MGVFSRVVRTTIPFGAAALTAYACTEDKGAAPFRILHAFANDASASSSAFDADFPRAQWNANWDFHCYLCDFIRDPMSLINERKFNKATDEDKAKMMEEATATQKRTIILVRHGHYDYKSKEHALDELGRGQAEIVGKRLAASHEKNPIEAVHMSTMTRATETANIILEQLPAGIARSSDANLEEGTPYPPTPHPNIPDDWVPTANKYYTERARVETAFRKYFYRAAPEQKKDTTEVIVAHGIIIRYLVCRALQLPLEAWNRLEVFNASITVVVIHPNGEVKLHALGDLGHLPEEKITLY